LRPARGGDQALGQQRDVEHIRPVELLVECQEVEQQRRQPAFVERRRDLPVAGTVTARAAAVSEHDQPLRRFWHLEVAEDLCATSHRDPNLAGACLGRRGIAGRTGQQLGDRARRGRGQLDVDLVGRDLDDGVPLVYEVPRGHVPLKHDALGNRLAHLGHLDLHGRRLRHCHFECMKQR